MSKIQEIQTEMIAALKNKDMARKETLSLLLSALKAKAKDKREDLTQEEENTIILKEIKQTEETLNTANGRQDIIEESTARIAILNEFAPKMMNEEEINIIIKKVLSDLSLDAPTAKEKGVIMKNLMPLVKGKADGGLVNQILSGYFKA
ncbi:MAG: GatB/YqeY domain-containing protein [Christensenellaceae bacterium]